MKHEPGMAYDTKFLNKIFAILSIILLLVVFWVFLEDYVRPWKMWQVKSLKIKREVLSKKYDEETKGIDEEKLKTLEADLVQAKKETEQYTKELSEIDKNVAVLDGKIYEMTMKNGEYNALKSAYTYDYEIAHMHHDKAKEKKFKKLLKKSAKGFKETKDQLKVFEEQKKSLLITKSEILSKVDSIDRKITAMTAASGRLKAAIEKTKVTPVTMLRNSPFLDYLDPTIKVHQIVLQDLTQDLYFRKVDKVDRCITCHTFIGDPGYEDQKNPFKTHPNLDLMVGANSPHPLKKTGCTTCHGGEGHRVRDFASVAHMPQNDEQELRWKKELGWHAPHKVPEVMKRVGFTEAACLKCHDTVVKVPQATVLNKGRDLIRTYGCNSCHKIKGLEPLSKPGPSLKKVASKLDSNFVKNWIWSPKKFNEHAKMPSYFQQSNNDKPEFLKNNVAEVNSMVAYLWDVSERYKPFARFEKGDAENGKELLSQVGCLGCHQANDLDEQFQKAQNRRGPHLSGLGSKLQGDWLVSWLLKPNHYQEDTIMPSLRLTNKEATDIATYLLSQRNQSFEKLKFDGLDKKVRDNLLITYFTAFDSTEKAKKKLSTMSDHQRTIELGRRSIGKYGCYTCHSIKGFESGNPIGPELSYVGSKPITQIDFGHEHMPHERDLWLLKHLENPRRWDAGKAKSFKDLNVMPNFYLKKDEVKAITVALLGQVSDHVPLRGKKILSASEAMAEKGFKTITKFNCQGCHKIDGDGGEITKNYEDDLNEGPPFLVRQGNRVHADWLFGFLDNIFTIRPWLSIRMPSYHFTEDDRNEIVTYFRSKTEKPAFEERMDKVVWRPGEREAAHQLFESYACASCHTTGFNDDEASAPSLYKVKERLRGDWVKEWLGNPQSILEYTVMPNFWEDGEAQEPDILGGDKKKQVEALTKYIMELGA